MGPIYALLASARHTVDLVMYELEDTQAEQLLAADAAHGVDVRVVLNSAYTGSENDAAFSYLNGHGVHVRWASSRVRPHPPEDARGGRLGGRDHDLELDQPLLLRHARRRGDRSHPRRCRCDRGDVRRRLQRNPDNAGSRRRSRLVTDHIRARAALPHQRCQPRPLCGERGDEQSGHHRRPRRGSAARRGGGDLHDQLEQLVFGVRELWSAPASTSGSTLRTPGSTSMPRCWSEIPGPPTRRPSSDRRTSRRSRSSTTASSVSFSPAARWLVSSRPRSRTTTPVRRRGRADQPGWEDGGVADELLTRLLEARSSVIADVAPTARSSWSAATTPAACRCTGCPPSGRDLIQLTFLDEPVCRGTLYSRVPTTSLLLSIVAVTRSISSGWWIVNGGEPRALVVEDNIKHDLGDVSRDGNLIAFTSTKRNGVDIDVYVLDRGRRQDPQSCSKAAGTGSSASRPTDAGLPSPASTVTFAISNDLLLVDVNERESAWWSREPVPEAQSHQPGTRTRRHSSSAPTAGRDVASIARYDIATAALALRARDRVGQRGDAQQ